MMNALSLRGDRLAILVLSIGLAACSLPHEKAYDTTPASQLGTTPTGVGLKVGEQAPDVATSRADGTSQSLAALHPGKPLVLVFYKGGWCPPCNYQLHQIANARADFERRGAVVAAVSVDGPAYASATQKEFQGAFEVLSDPDLVVHRAFRVVDPMGSFDRLALGSMGVHLDDRSGREHHQVAVPSIFVVDASGVVRWAHADRDYATRPSVEQILVALDQG